MKIDFHNVPNILALKLSVIDCLATPLILYRPCLYRSESKIIRIIRHVPSTTSLQRSILPRLGGNKTVPIDESLRSFLDGRQVVRRAGAEVVPHTVRLRFEYISRKTHMTV